MACGEDESGGLALFTHAGHADGSAVVPTGIPGVPPVPVCCAGQHPVVIDGELLREKRRDAGLSRERLASAAEVSITTISKLERESRPGCYLTLAAGAGATLRELMDRMGHDSQRAAMIYLKCRELHQPGEKLQVSSSQDRWNGVPPIPVPAL